MEDSEHKYFVNALREFLRLPPLYGGKAVTPEMKNGEPKYQTNASVKRELRRFYESAFR